MHFTNSQFTGYTWEFTLLHHVLLTNSEYLDVEVTLQLTVGQSVSQSVCQGIEPTLGLVTRYYFLSESVTLQLRVSQCVLVSSPLHGPLSRYCFPFMSREFVALSVWGALSDKRPRLSFVSQSDFMAESQSVSMSWCRAHFADVWSDIASFWRVRVWNSLFCLCRAPSLTRGRVCPL
jgi:hypothetical protein